MFVQFARLYGVIICDEMYFIRLFRAISFSVCCDCKILSATRWWSNPEHGKHTWRVNYYFCQHLLIFNIYK